MRDVLPCVHQGDRPQDDGSTEGGFRRRLPVGNPAKLRRYLSFSEREEIAILHARGCGVREVARQIRRSPSTIFRELRRNAATLNSRPRKALAWITPAEALNSLIKRYSVPTTPETQAQHRSKQ